MCLFGQRCSRLVRPRASPCRVLTPGLVGKTNALARLVTMSAVGGLLVAGVLLPTVGGLGITARNAADKFQALSTNLPSQLPQRSVMLDSHGKVLAHFFGHLYGRSEQVIDRVRVSFSQIAPVMRASIVAIEDSRYYQHGGIDIKGTVRAAIQNLHGGSVQGGSTIAQQYVKNVMILTAKSQEQAQLAESDTIARKIRELRYAVAVEHETTKNKLLADYLNVAYFGQQAYGVEVAAERYFGTSAAALTLPQAALLAGIVQNPSAYDPMTNPSAALTRRNNLLARMAHLNLITPAQARRAGRNKIYGSPTRSQPDATTVDYAVGPQYNGSYGMQIGSTGKVYTMVAALQQGIPFGFSMTVPFQTTVTGYTNCHGDPTGLDPQSNQQGAWTAHNDDSERGGGYTLYTGTTQSINTFFARLEQKVGLCNVVKAAGQMGQTCPDGKSLLKPDPSEGHHYSADNDASFTLGADNVAPIDVAPSDATLPARGIYCHPTAANSISDRSGKALPVESAGCHQVLPPEIADAANYILAGDLTAGAASGFWNDSIRIPAASQTRTADQYRYAAFVGYTPGLLGAVGVGNPPHP